MGALTNEAYFKSLSADDWDKAEAIEAEIGKLLTEGFTEELSIKFVRTVMDVRKATPRATVWGIFATALGAGLDYVGHKDTIARVAHAFSTDPKPRRGKLSRKRGVRGV